MDHRIILAVVLPFLATWAPLAQGSGPPLAEFSRLVCELQHQEPHEHARQRLLRLIEVIEAQGTSGDHAIPHLVAAFDIDDEHLRRAAALAIPKVCARHAETFPSLILLAYDKDAYWRARTSERDLILAAGSELPNEPLLELLQHADWRVRCWAIVQLQERLRERERAAFRAAKQRQDKQRQAIDVEAAIIEAAGPLPAALIQLLDDPHADVRAFALQGLSPSWTFHEEMAASLPRLLRDETLLQHRRSGFDPPGFPLGKTVREAAIHAAAHAAHPQFTPLLTDLAASDPDPSVRAACQTALSLRPRLPPAVLNAARQR